MGVEIWGRERLIGPSRRRLWRVHRSAQALLGRAEVVLTEMQVRWATMSTCVSFAVPCSPSLRLSMPGWLRQAIAERPRGLPSEKRSGWLPTFAFLRRPTLRCHGRRLHTSLTPLTLHTQSCGRERPGTKCPRTASTESAGALLKRRCPQQSFMWPERSHLL